MSNFDNVCLIPIRLSHNFAYSWKKVECKGDRNTSSLEERQFLDLVPIYLLRT